MNVVRVEAASPDLEKWTQRGYFELRVDEFVSGQVMIDTGTMVVGVGVCNGKLERSGALFSDAVWDAFDKALEWERDRDLVMFRFGETCPTCGGLHISRFAHDAGQAVEEYLNCWRSGAAGQAHNVIENWFARIYLRGVHDGRAGK